MRKVYLFFIILISFNFEVLSQQTDSLPVSLFDSVLLQNELTGDSLILRGNALIAVSQDSIDVPINYGAKDSVQFDYAHKIIHLYGEAFILYKTMDLKAAYIAIDMNNNIATAVPTRDSLDQPVGVPKFKDGDQSFNAQKINYNFKTRKGTITQVVSQEGDIYIHGEQTKFISKQSKDSGGDDIIYNKNAIFTTCDNPEPHFGIHSKKQKLIPNKLVIVGPSNVVIMGVPTPLWLPFGFFPISKDARSGIIFPKNYDYNQNWGFGIKDFGYYWPVSDHLSLKFIGDIYFKGSFGIGVNGKYKVRYKYTGNFDVNFANRVNEQFGTYKKLKDRPIRLSFTHNQDAGAHPYQNIGGNINIQTGLYDRLINTNAKSVLSNTLNSNFYYKYDFPNSPFSLNAGMSHSQNNLTRQINITFPSIDINMRSITPFKSKTRISAVEKWYDKITFSYNSSFRNSLNTFDSLLFKPTSLDVLKFGARHNLRTEANFNVLKYFNLTPSINYTEEWFFKKQLLVLDTIREVDTLGRDTIFGRERQILSKGFFPMRNFTADLSTSTQIYGQILSAKGWFRGIRHHITPSASLSFAPDYHASPYNYFNTVNTHLIPEENRVKEYLIFANSPFGTTSVGGENFVLNMNVNNRIEIKHYSKKDSTSKKIALIENFNLSSTYNFFADSFKLSVITGSGNNRFFDGITTISYGIILDPYAREIKNNKEIRKNKFAVKTNNRFFYLTNAYMSISNNMSVEQFRKLFNNKSTTPDPNAIPSLYDIFKNFAINHNINYVYSRLETGKDTIIQSVHSLAINGYIPISKNWRVNLGNISYDFQAKAMVYPSLGLERDLHCWVMRFDWAPEYGSYTFSLGVKPGSLDFIQLPSNQYYTGSR
ncbi:MAG: hypothetical protein M3Q56_03555 [Bacteroidota bacterium]|nr:hypothetical protein [Bacteroidota bacterium]